MFSSDEWSAFLAGVGSGEARMTDRAMAPPGTGRDWLVAGDVEQALTGYVVDQPDRRRRKARSHRQEITRHAE